MILKIEFVKSDLARINAALTRLDQAAISAKENLPIRNAMDYVDLLTKNITSQKYMLASGQYNKRYKSWKQQQNVGMKYWLLGRDLINSLSVFGHEGGWIGGVPEDVYESQTKSWLRPMGSVIGKKKKIAMYGWANEGLRPVFKPTKEEYRQNGMVDRAKDVINVFAMNWR